MNTFYEHHHDSIRFAYRCFDRILLNGLIQPFQQPERVVGFFNTYRQLYPVSRHTLRDIAEQFQRWLKGWSDRKSTRLNSSHLVISYGVFCLIKKMMEYATLMVNRIRMPTM